MTKASDNVFPRLLISEGGSTATPASGQVTVYAKADGLLYSKDDAGAETALGGASGGGESLLNLFVGAIPPWSASTITAPPAANRIYLEKYTPMVDETVSMARWTATTSAGNLDFGIYNSDLSTLLASTGSFASPGTGARSQAFAAAATVALDAGTIYYLAMGASSTSLRVPMWTPLAAGPGLNLWGREESTFPLPSSIAAVDSWEDVFNVPIFFFD